jgi:hypothetical protein
MTKREIFLIAHEQRRTRGISMSLALRQAYALRKCRGFSIPGKSHVVDDLGGWLASMARKDAVRPGILAAYSIPTE